MRRQVTKKTINIDLHIRDLKLQNEYDNENAKFEGIRSFYSFSLNILKLQKQNDNEFDNEI